MNLFSTKKIKKGDTVVINKKGFAYYGNPDHTFESFKIADGVKEREFTMAVCELFSILGTGKVIRVNENAACVRFENKILGMRFCFTHYYEFEDIEKLTIIKRIKRFLGVSC